MSLAEVGTVSLVLLLEMVSEPQKVFQGLQVIKVFNYRIKINKTAATEMIKKIQYKNLILFHIHSSFYFCTALQQKILIIKYPVLLLNSIGKKIIPP